MLALEKLDGVAWLGGSRYTWEIQASTSEQPNEQYNKRTVKPKEQRLPDTVNKRGEFVS